MSKTNSIEGFFKSVSGDIFEIKVMQGVANIKRRGEDRFTELPGGAEGWLWGYNYSLKRAGNDILLSRGVSIGENPELCRRIEIEDLKLFDSPPDKS